MYKQCARCKRINFWFLVKRRKYVMPLVSPRPIVSDDELCKPCFKWIKRETLKLLNEQTQEQK